MDEQKLTTPSEQPPVKKSKGKWKLLTTGIIAENPIFVLFLGMCPVLATTSSFSSAFGMGLAVIAVLMLTNVLISLVRKWVPNEIRIPIYIVIIASVVTIVEMLMNAFMFDLAQTLGVYLSIIVVNCIILGRAEAFASKNTVLDSLLDGIGTGIGYFLGVVIVALARELIGTFGLGFKNPFTGDVVFQLYFISKEFAQKYAINIFTGNAGAFIMYGLLTAGFIALNETVKQKQAAKAKKLVAQTAGGQQ